MELVRISCVCSLPVSEGLWSTRLVRRDHTVVPLENIVCRWLSLKVKLLGMCRTNIHTHTRTITHALTHNARTRTHSHTRTHTRTHSRTHARTHTRTHDHSLNQSRTHTHAHTRTHTWWPDCTLICLQDALARTHRVHTHTE